MGAYVNPKDESKESFLKREGVPVSNIAWEDVPANQLPVVWMNNGPFAAAGIAYCKSELDAFTRPDDHREKRIYLVEKKKLLAVSDLKHYIGIDK
jgi:hypothetical protein